MSLLLDTHVWLWLLVRPDRLPETIRSELAEVEHLALSAASVWEVAIKSRLGKLDLPLSVADLVTTSYRDAGLRGLAVDARHAAAVADLPPLHRDPFDRLLVAQAQVEGLTLVTADPHVQAYEVSVRAV